MVYGGLQVGPCPVAAGLVGRLRRGFTARCHGPLAAAALAGAGGSSVATALSLGGAGGVSPLAGATAAEAGGGALRATRRATKTRATTSPSTATASHREERRPGAISPTLTTPLLVPSGGSSFKAPPRE